MTESDIQRQITFAAERAGCLVFRMNAGRGRYNQRLMPAGTPDLLLVAHDGRVMWVEVKAGDGQLREPQIEMHMALSARGHNVLVARSVAEVMEALK